MRLQAINKELRQIKICHLFAVLATLGMVFDIFALVYQPFLVFNRLTMTSVTPVPYVVRNLVHQYWRKERGKSFARVRKLTTFL